MTELKLKSWQCSYVAMQFPVNVPKKCRYTLPLYLVNEKMSPNSTDRKMQAARLCSLLNEHLFI